MILSLLPWMFALAACHGGGLGKDYECERPAGAPTDRGYVGDAGEDGCVADNACVSEPGDEGGTCVRGAQCVLDGLSTGAGFSKDCASGEVCVVEGDVIWGVCESLEEATDDIGGTLDCEQPYTHELNVEAGEVVEFFALFSPPADPDAGVTVSTLLEDGTGPLVSGEDVLGEDLAVGSRTESYELRHSFQSAATLEWVFEVDSCNTTDFSAAYTRVSGPVVNGSRATAMPLASGESVSGLLGCFDQTGAGSDVHLMHYYALLATRGQTLHLSLVAENWLGGGLTGWLYLWLYDDSGPVLDDAGDPVGVSTYESSDVTLDYKVAKAGDYYLVLDQDPTWCDVARYTISY